MISPSACQPWQPDPRQLSPAQEKRSYTTSGDAITPGADRPRLAQHALLVQLVRTLARQAVAERGVQPAPPQSPTPEVCT